MMKIVECPRDAWQGIHHFIDTKLKAEYVNQLLKVGFDTIDVGSFVSPKAMPQVADTAELLEKLDLDENSSKLGVIVANKKGALQAIEFEQVTYLGYPLSVSETFQIRNTKRNLEQSLLLVEEIQNICSQNQKTLLIYLSMGFGNPYEDPYSPEIVAEFTKKMANLGIQVISLSDTVGVSTPNNIQPLFETLITEFPEIEFGAHLHSTSNTISEKLKAAYQGGCRRFDGAIAGFGGCPMAQNDLVGNIATENMLQFFQEQNIALNLNIKAFQEAQQLANQVFL